MKENEMERLSLMHISNANGGDLIYRATRNGFSAASFHAICDNQKNVLIIIKANNNYIFGGYISVGLSNESYEINDPNAYIFSLRRGKDSQIHKMKIKSKTAITYRNGYFLTFGSTGATCSPLNYDISITDSPNDRKKSGVEKNHCYIGRSYQLPDNFNDSTESQSSIKEFLAGKYDGWLVDEIEVYKLKF